MTQDYKLSLPAAVLINVNIMLGIGIFLNTALLTRETGALGFLTYALVGILLLPLVISIAKLLELHPAGGFYTFATQELNQASGFMSAWIYFTGKLASSTIMIHTSMLIFQKLFPVLETVSTFTLDITLITAFIALNMYNIKAGRNIQILFTLFKAIPVFFVIASGLYIYNGQNFARSNQLWEGIPMALPLIVYAVMGFEAAASLSSKIQNARKNAPRAVLISYAIIVCILTAYQFFFYASLGTSLAQASYREAYPQLLTLLLPLQTVLSAKLAGLINLAIATSALGGAYGILFSNSWNLHILAHNKLLPSSAFIAQLNKHAIPFICVVAEGVLCLGYLLLTSGNQILLQQISALAAVTTYTISAVALLAAKRARPEISINRFIPLLGLINCLILAGACLLGLARTGITALYGFMVLVATGFLLYQLCMRRMAK